MRVVRWEEIRSPESHVRHAGASQTSRGPQVEVGSSDPRDASRAGNDSHAQPGMAHMDSGRLDRFGEPSGVVLSLVRTAIQLSAGACLAVGWHYAAHRVLSAGDPVEFAAELGLPLRSE